jgi:hypothetical protein
MKEPADMEAVIWVGRGMLVIDVDHLMELELDGMGWDGVLCCAMTYSSLHVRVRVVEVFEILLAIDPGRHGRDIEAEEGAADGAEGG